MRLGVGYQTDSEGKPFDGTNRCTGAFWSITVDRFVYDNEINRYSINSSMAARPAGTEVWLLTWIGGADLIASPAL